MVNVSPPNQEFKPGLEDLCSLPVWTSTFPKKEEELIKMECTRRGGAHNKHVAGSGSANPWFGVMCEPTPYVLEMYESTVGRGNQKARQKFLALIRSEAV